jgi:hypothetical protein
MMRAYLISALALLAAACQREPDPAQKAAEDAKAVAMVEAAQDQHGPPRPLSPQPITGQDIEKNRLFGAGCAFAPEGWGDPVLLTRPKAAAMNLDRRLATLASDPGGQQFPLGTWEHYVGKGLSLRLEKAAGDGAVPDEEALRWPAKLTVRDEYDRIVYIAAGTLTCRG